MFIYLFGTRNFMNIFNKMSISMKIYLIPTIGTLTFFVYLILSTVTANINVSVLTAAKDIQFPVVQYSKEVAVSIEKVSDLLNSAVTTGDEDSISVADEITDNIHVLINKIGATDKRFSSVKRKMLTEYDHYYQQAKALSLGMVNETIDFSKLPVMGKEMNKS